MSSNNIYRNNAEDCLRMAQTVASDGDRPIAPALTWRRAAALQLQVRVMSAADEQCQSTLAPDALTTSAHFGISDFT